jgi:hypothetical protein
MCASRRKGVRCFFSRFNIVYQPSRLFMLHIAQYNLRGAEGVVHSYAQRERD